MNYFHFFSFIYIEPYPPPIYLRLAKANGKQLIFTWEPINHTSSCPSYYESLFNCSECAITSDSANCRLSTSIFTSDAKVCSFAVRTIVCGNILGNISETVNVILKGLILCIHVCTYSHFYCIYEAI